MTLENVIAGIVAAIAVIGIGFGSAPTIGDHNSAATIRVEEDSPLWNCHTMGNHICGTK